MDYPYTVFKNSAVPSSGSNLYHERLHVPLWWWPCGALFVGILGYEISLASRHWKEMWAVYLLLAALGSWLLFSMGRTTIRVDAERELFADKARLPVSAIARAAIIPATAKSAAVGRQLDPAAYLIHKPWVKQLVLLVLNDPEDPTPYWLVSTRHPEKILQALELNNAAATPLDESKKIT